MKFAYFLISVFLVALIVVSCHKNNSGKPTLTLASINTTVLMNDSMRVLFNFTNSGGTLGNGTFFSLRTRINQNPPANESGGDTVTTPIPDFSGSSKGQFRYALPWDGYLSSGGKENDTLVFKFYALTPDSVSSDTITSPKIVILNQ
jgi:hypothetical protein